MHSEYTRSERRRLLHPDGGGVAFCCRSATRSCHRHHRGPSPADPVLEAPPKLERQVSFSSDLYPFCLCGDFSLGELRRADPDGGD